MAVQNDDDEAPQNGRRTMTSAGERAETSAAALEKQEFVNRYSREARKRWSAEIDRSFKTMDRAMADNPGAPLFGGGGSMAETRNFYFLMQGLLLAMSVPLVDAILIAGSYASVKVKQDEDALRDREPHGTA